jgi:hypothetical protein
MTKNIKVPQTPSNQKTILLIDGGAFGIGCVQKAMIPVVHNTLWDITGNNQYQLRSYRISAEVASPSLTPTVHTQPNSWVKRKNIEGGTK